MADVITAVLPNWAKMLTVLERAPSHQPSAAAGVASGAEVAKAASAKGSPYVIIVTYSALRAVEIVKYVI